MKRQNYAPEIREELDRLAAEGLSVDSLARDYEPSTVTVHNWIRRSMSEVGSCFDNAMAELFFTSLETELLKHVRFKNREETRCGVIQYIEGSCNTRRLHSTLDRAPPVKYERK